MQSQHQLLVPGDGDSLALEELLGELAPVERPSTEQSTAGRAFAGLHSEKPTVESAPPPFQEVQAVADSSLDIPPAHFAADTADVHLAVDSPPDIAAVDSRAEHILAAHNRVAEDSSVARSPVAERPAGDSQIVDTQAVQWDNHSQAEDLRLAGRS